MLKKKVLRVVTLALTTAIVGAAAFVCANGASNVNAWGSAPGEEATGINSLTGEEETYSVVKSTTDDTYFFDGYYTNKTESADLGIPQTVKLVSEKRTVTITGVTEGACEDYQISRLKLPNTCKIIGKEAFKNCTGLVEVQFPTSLQFIRDNAFRGCELLRTVDLSKCSDLNIDKGDSFIIGGALPGFGNGAFRGCKALKEVIFPTDAPAFDRIPSEMFLECAGLSTIKIPGTVQEIDTKAFKDCILLENVIFDNDGELTVIDKEAFKGCTGLTKIDAPKSLGVIGESAFDSCEKLQYFNLPSNSELFRLMKKAFTKTKLQKFSIPASCKQLFLIGEAAFAECSELTSFVCKSGSVATFDKQAFMNCSKLKSVDFTTNVTGIGDSCFKGCKVLGNIASSSKNMIKSVVNIGPAAFQGCEAFTEFIVPDVPTIGDNTFNGCKNISKVSFAGTQLTKIGDSAFANCEKAVFTGKIPASVTVIGDKAFSGCKSATSIVLPSALTKIGSYAFYECSALKNMVIPSGVEVLYKYTFARCSSLKSVDLSGVTDEVLPEGLFEECDSLETVTLNNSITTISDRAFRYCSNLGKNGQLLLPSSLVYLGVESFRDCKSISKIVIPSGVATIPSGCFRGCTNLRDLNLSKVESVEDYAFADCFSNIGTSGSPDLVDDFRLPSTLRFLGQYSFSKCKALQYVIIPENDYLTDIPAGCFASCSYLEYVRIPDTITFIGSNAFASCALRAVEISSIEDAVLKSAFRNNNELHRVEINNGTAKIMKFLGNNRAIMVPADIYKIPVTEIAENAYDYCDISYVSVPSSVKKIGSKAFANCSKLETIRIPSSTTITSDAFSGCSAVYQISDIDDKTLSIKKFYGTISNLEIPANLTVVDEQKSLDQGKSSTTGKSVVEIGNSAFEGNLFLKTVTLPKTVTKIGARAFCDCSNATINYPAAAEVGTDAFKNVVAAIPYGSAAPTPKKPTPIDGPTPAPSNGSIGDFVERLYTIALNRASEEEGKKYWVNEITSGRKTGADCARFFLIDAGEFAKRGLNNSDFLDVLYRTFFGRESDQNGKDFWLKEMKKGATRERVVWGFIDSKEWCNICAGYGVKSGAPTAKATVPSKNAKDFATRLYTCCLKRDPEKDGLNYWALALTNLEKTGSDAAQFFFESKEFVGYKTSNREYLTRMYTTFMDREPEAGGMDYWLKEMENGKSRHDVLAWFASSPEFTKICAKYAIERGTIK